MKPFAKSVVTRLSLVIALLPGILASSELRAAPLASDTVAAYRAIAVSRFEQMKAVREAHEALRARGYVFYTRPTPALLSVNCVSQFEVCKPIYLVTQGAIAPGNELSADHGLRGRHLSDDTFSFGRLDDHDRPDAPAADSPERRRLVALTVGKICRS